MKKKLIIGGAILGSIIVVAAILITILLLTNKKITISFDSNGGNAISAMKIKKGETIALPKAKKKGYKLDGWFLNSKRVDESKKYYKDTTLKARWIDKDAEIFTVTFDSDGGSMVDDIIVECGKELLLPTNPTKEGYSFVSWNDKYNNVVENKTKLACENVTLKANWKEDGKKEDTSKKTTTKKGVETQKAKSYKCPSGYTLSRTKCTVTTNSTEECPSGYNWSTKVNKCVAKTTVSKKCDGYEAGGYCFEEIYYGKDQTDCAFYYGTNYINGVCYHWKKDFTYTCPSGYTLYHSDPNFGLGDVCVALSNKTKTCPSGYSLSGNSCVKTIDATYE